MNEWNKWSKKTYWRRGNPNRALKDGQYLTRREEEGLPTQLGALQSKAGRGTIHIAAILDKGGRCSSSVSQDEAEVP